MKCIMIFSPRSEQFDDIYFSVEDGLAESRHVFLQQNDLPNRFQGKSRFTICEAGFGTGLNFLCAWTLFEQSTRPNQQLDYISFEKYPLSSADILKYLAHWGSEFDGRLERLVELYPLRIGGWHRIRVSAQVTLTLIFDDVNRALPQLDGAVDCWFLDGHAPAKNPDMWSDIIFSQMGRLSAAGARVSTFTAAGFVRRGLKNAGFQVSKVRGYGRKCDMTVGEFCGQGVLPVAIQYPGRVAVIGGGIAGASLCSALARRGVLVDLYEKHELASGGSGNLRGLFNPRFTARLGDEADFYSSAFRHGLCEFSDLQTRHDVGLLPCGSLHIILDEDKLKRSEGFIQNWGWHKDHARIVDRDEAREISGVPLSYGALFLPDAGMISPKLVVEALAQSANIIMEEVGSLSKQGHVWIVNNREYDAVVLAGAHDVLKFPHVSWLPIHTVRGQVSLMDPPEIFSGLKTNLCHGGYASHPFDGTMVVGSTFKPWLDHLDVTEEDHVEVLQKLAVVVDGYDGVSLVKGGRAAFRCAANDRVPVIGRVPDWDGLYLSVAHGSHGLSTATLGAEIIVAQMAGESPPVPRNVLKFLSAQRFIDRKARKGS